MSFHGFNGEFSYDPNYQNTDVDLKGVQEALDEEVGYVFPIVDLQHGKNRAVLFFAQKEVGEPPGKTCLMYESEDRKLFRGPLEDVPRSREEFARSLKAWTIGDHKFTEEMERRNDLWKHVHRLSNLGEDAADSVMKPEQEV